MCGHAARVVLNEPPTCTARCFSRLSASAFGKPAHLTMPALLIKTSTRPNRSTAASTSACAPGGVATSLVSAMAAPPAATISEATADAGSASVPSPSIEPPRSLTTTLAPRSPSSSAYARPMPRPAPVTTATRPSKLRDSGSDGGLEAEEVAEGAAEHGGPLVVGDAGEERLDQLLAAAERSLGVRIVGPPDDRRQAGDVAGRDCDRVVPEQHRE